MNEIYMDEFYGRDHMQKLLQEAEEARRARNVTSAGGINRGLKRVRKLISKAVSNIID